MRDTGRGARIASLSAARRSVAIAQASADDEETTLTGLSGKAPFVSKWVVVATVQLELVPGQRL